MSFSRQSTSPVSKLEGKPPPSADILYVFDEMCHNVPDHDISGVFTLLSVAIKQKLVQADVARDMFTKAWPVFCGRQLDAALVSLAPVLAQAFPDDRNEDAVAFLEQVWACDEPFTPSKLSRKHPAWRYLPSGSLRWQPIYLWVGCELMKFDKQRQQAIESDFKPLETISVKFKNDIYGLVIGSEGVALAERERGIPIFDPPRPLLYLERIEQMKMRGSKKKGGGGRN